MDGVEQFAEGIGYEFQGCVIKLVAIGVALAFGTVGYKLGSISGKGLIGLGVLFALALVSQIGIRVFKHGAH